MDQLSGQKQIKRDQFYKIQGFQRQLQNSDDNLIVASQSTFIL